MTGSAIVLAGGFGTRLQKVVSELPKPMAPVAGKPFLQYVLDYLGKQGIDTAILAVGYLRNTIIEYFGDEYNGLIIKYSAEDEPLGTGGAIKQACAMADGENVFVINGDTFFDVDLAQLFRFHISNQALLSVALKRMEKFDRYGTVEINDRNKITGFREKEYLDEGLINGGVYCLNKNIFPDSIPQKFSFETEILEKEIKTGKIFGLESKGYFIDIGIPEDYEKAQTDFIDV